MRFWFENLNSGISIGLKARNFGNKHFATARSPYTEKRSEEKALGAEVWNHSPTIAILREANEFCLRIIEFEPKNPKKNYKSVSLVKI